MASNAESVDHYELEGKQSYDYDPTILTEINEGFLDLQTAILAKLGIEWGLFPMGPGGIIGGNYKLTRTNVTGTENGNGDFLYEFHQGKVTAGLDWQWEYYGGLIDSIIDGYRFHNPKTDAWLFCITAISGDPNFADSDEGTGQTSNW